MAAHHRRTPSISSFSDMDHSGPSPLRARKMSTGGNRSWSEEEETYLLQTRMQKMPYKHIAQHLKKTELACRLHYHQLSHGSHRRKRNASISSTTSSIVSGSTGTTSSQFELPNEIAEEYTQTMTPPRQESPMMTVEAAQAHQQKILLPRLHPRIITPQSSPEPRAGLRLDTNSVAVHNANNSASTHSANHSAASSMVMPFHHHGYQPAHQEGHPLPSTLTNPSGQASRQHSRASSLGPVDTARLRNIYEAHRTAFWASVAADYGPDVSAAQLEDVWRQGGSGSPLCPSFFNKSDKGLGLHIPRPPTPPGESPNGTTLAMGSMQAQLPLPAFKNSGWAAVNRQEAAAHGERRESRTAISALLTEERDPRP